MEGEDTWYHVHGSELRRLDMPTRRYALHFVLREYIQKHINFSLTKVKKELQNFCPRCGDYVDQIQCAHVGERNSDYLHNLIDANPEKDFLELLEIALRHHRENVIIAPVCRTCNKELEN